MTGTGMRGIDMKLEIVVIPVSDVDRAKAFYAGLGWREDADFASGDDFRVIQFTPPGSGCSVIFGRNVTPAAPGSAQGLYLIVPDLEAARADLIARGVKVEHNPVVELLGQAPALEAVRLQDGRVIPMAAVFTSSETSMASPLAEQLGCAFDEGPFGPVIRTGENKETSVRGVYAAGDAASAMHNATLASASGVLAGVHCHQSLSMPSGH